MSPYSTDTRGLTLDGVALADIAASVATPCYVYSAADIRDAYMRLDAAFGDYPHAIH
nr:diaminopimelate decarboxylase [Acidobacteriota bacterium]